MAKKQIQALQFCTNVQSSILCKLRLNLYLVKYSLVFFKCGNGGKCSMA